LDNGDGAYIKVYNKWSTGEGGIDSTVRVDNEQKALAYADHLSETNPTLKGFTPAMIGRLDTNAIMIGKLPGEPLHKMNPEARKAIPPEAWSAFEKNLQILNSHGIHHGDIVAQN